MQYLLLIYEAEKIWEDMDKADKQSALKQYAALTAEMRTRGAFVAGDGLRPTNTATTIRVRQGKTITSDGPFAETREQLGGFYLVECKDIDEAIEFASKIPTAITGSIEIRPIAVYK